MGVTGASGWVAVETKRLLERRYPRFVHARDPKSLENGYLPFFTFHTMEPFTLEAKLRYLAENDYSTLTLERALAHLRGERRAPPRSVVLTIDDGRLSTWSVAGPLLRRYGMTATAFVIPGYLEKGPPRSTLEDGKPSGGLEAPLDESRDRRTLLRWTEVRKLHATGTVHVESHTMLHRRVAVSEQIVGFVSPGMDTAPYDLPLPPDRREGWSDAALEQRLGAPVFEHEAVLGTVQALDPPCAVFERCAELVQREGGVQFFQRRGWHRRLAREAGRPAPGSFRSYDTRDLQWWELAEARVALERQLEGKRVRHLCLPSGQGSSRAVCLARDTGHETLLWGLLPGRRSNRPGSDPMYIERLKHDFIFRLPGRRRWSLARLLAEKALRRLRGETGY